MTTSYTLASDYQRLSRSGLQRSSVEAANHLAMVPTKPAENSNVAPDLFLIVAEI